MMSIVQVTCIGSAVVFPSESIIEVQLIVRTSSDIVLSSTVVSTLTAQNIQAGFNIAITGTNVFYSARVSTLSLAQLTLSVDYRDLGLIVLDQFVAVDQFTVIQTALNTLYASNLAGACACACASRRIGSML